MKRFNFFHVHFARFLSVLSLVIGLSAITPLAGQNQPSTAETPGKPAGSTIKLPSPQPVVGLPNLTLVEEKLTAYHDCTCTCGCYHRDLERVGGRALGFLQQYSKSPRPKTEKPAVVIDIDETALSNWDNMKKMSFAYDRDEYIAWEKEAKAPAIKPVFQIFEFARDHGMATIFLTSRHEDEREITVKDLESAGYQDWTSLKMRMPDSPRPVADFKSGERKKLEDAGYTIVVNIGDQDSDLAGEPSLRSFKLPNPFYYLR